MPTPLVTNDFEAVQDNLRDRINHALSQNDAEVFLEAVQECRNLRILKGYIFSFTEKLGKANAGDEDAANFREKALRPFLDHLSAVEQAERHQQLQPA